MNFKIIVDSCCDLTPEYKANEAFVSVPLTLTVEDKDIVDDDTFNQAEFLRLVRQSKECAKSACPSPEKYLSEIEKVQGDVYIVTLSAELSGSFNSARVAADMYKEQGGTNNVHVFNSCSASSGEVLIALKAYENASAGKTFDEVVEITEKYRESMTTFFVLETLETLRKNGRLTHLEAIIAKTLNIKPVMRGTSEGRIAKVEQTRGLNKALVRMVNIIAGEVKNQEDKKMVIAHCNNMEAAELVAKTTRELCRFKEIIITETAGVSSLYANDGGIVVSA